MFMRTLILSACLSTLGFAMSACTTTDSDSDTANNEDTTGEPGTSGDGDGDGDPSGDGDGDGDPTVTGGDGDGDGDGEDCTGITPDASGAALTADCSADASDGQGDNACTQAGGDFCIQGPNYAICLDTVFCESDCECAIEPDTGRQGSCVTDWLIDGNMNSIGSCVLECDAGNPCPDGMVCGGFGGGYDLCLWTEECGDGIINFDETCEDGMVLSCEDLGFDSGMTTCDACQLDTSSCASTCGNGNITAGEQCEGMDFNGETCGSLGFAGADPMDPADDGMLACGDPMAMDACQFDTAGCLSSCGNGVAEPDGVEFCDGADLGLSIGNDIKGGTAQPDGEVDCRDLGYLTAGTLACATDCTFDTSGCTATCGNNALEPGEECDSAQFPDNNNDGSDDTDCADYGQGTGTVSCNSDCTLDFSACM